MRNRRKNPSLYKKIQTLNSLEDAINLAYDNFFTHNLNQEETLRLIAFAMELFTGEPVKGYEHVIYEN